MTIIPWNAEAPSLQREIFFASVVVSKTHLEWRTLQSRSAAPGAFVCENQRIHKMFGMFVLSRTNSPRIVYQSVKYLAIFWDFYPTKKAPKNTSEKGGLFVYLLEIAIV